MKTYLLLVAICLHKEEKFFTPLLLQFQIILNSMHKYIPCMKITCQKDGYTQSYRFPETTFVAVTAYQSTGVRSNSNSEYTKLPLNCELNPNTVILVLVELNPFP